MVSPSNTPKFSPLRMPQTRPDHAATVKPLAVESLDADMSAAEATPSDSLLVSSNA